MTEQYAEIPRPVKPGLVMPTEQGRWLFTLVDVNDVPWLINAVPFYSAGMAKGAMRDLVAKLNGSPPVERPRPRLEVVS